ncbi:hypothetical protein nvc2_049 [Namao virus]|nr:hypothetical protein nvc2_049 [Namao virus]
MELLERYGISKQVSDQLKNQYVVTKYVTIGYGDTNVYLYDSYMDLYFVVNPKKKCDLKICSKHESILSTRVNSYNSRVLCLYIKMVSSIQDEKESTCKFPLMVFNKELYTVINLKDFTIKKCNLNMIPLENQPICHFDSQETDLLVARCLSALFEFMEPRYKRCDARHMFPRQMIFIPLTMGN